MEWKINKIKKWYKLSFLSIFGILNWNIKDVFVSLGKHKGHNWPFSFIESFQMKTINMNWVNIVKVIINLICNVILSQRFSHINIMK